MTDNISILTPQYQLIPRVTDDDGVDSVRAIVLRPDYVPDPDNLTPELPSIEFLKQYNGSNDYVGTYDKIDKPGDYQIMIYAMDTKCNISMKQVTVTFKNPTCKAILVAGGFLSDELSFATDKNIKLAYDTLILQGYTKEDIYVLSPEPISDINATIVSPDWDTLKGAIEEWACQGTQDVAVYMTGNGKEGGEFQLNDKWLKAEDLNTSLNILQEKIQGILTVILDFDYSGSFLPLLTPQEDKKRIVISSTSDDRKAHFLLEGKISFSNFFWREINSGVNIGDSFSNAKTAIKEFFNYTDDKVCLLDADGNGIGNEKNIDISSAKAYTISKEIISLPDEQPCIGTISPESVLECKETAATVWADNVTPFDTITNVLAIVMPPDCNNTAEEFTLNKIKDGRYEGTYSNFNLYGQYQITVLAMDKYGRMSYSEKTSVTRQICPDIYEDDDGSEHPGYIVINDIPSQRHNFDVAGDEDWIKFYAIPSADPLKERKYSIQATNLDENCDVVIELYNASMIPMLEKPFDNSEDSHADEILNWTCKEEGIYYVKIRHADPNIFGDGTEYDFKISTTDLSGDWGHVKGFIKDACTEEPIIGAIVKTNGGGYRSHPSHKRRIYHCPRSRNRYNNS